METKEQILHQLGYSVESDIQKKYLFDLVISQAMDIYANEKYKHSTEIKQRIINEIKLKLWMIKFIMQ